MKPVFNIINYDNITSTNDEAKHLLNTKETSEFTIIFTKEQSKGRGQRENNWHSYPGKNLLFSIITYPKNIKPQDQFYLSKIISLGIMDYLNSKQEGFKIKWPNDIYYRNKKICGILIENSLSGSNIKNSIIGIGLNVNQKTFPNYLPDAISLNNVTNKTYNLKDELYLLLNDIFENYKNLKPENFSQIDNKYHNQLYKKGEISEFKDKTGKFKGIITGTLPEGKLIIQRTGGDLKYYNFKEVEFCK